MDELLAKDPTNLKAYSLRAELLLKAGEIELARKDLTAVADISKHTGDSDLADAAQAQIGFYYYRQGNLKAASLETDRILKQNPQNYKAYALKAMLFFKQGKKDDARKEILSGIKIAQETQNLKAFQQLEGLLEYMNPPKPAANAPSQASAGSSAPSAGQPPAASPIQIKIVPKTAAPVSPKKPAQSLKIKLVPEKK